MRKIALAGIVCSALVPRAPLPIKHSAPRAGHRLVLGSGVPRAPSAAAWAARSSPARAVSLEAPAIAATTMTATGMFTTTLAVSGG